MFESISFCRQDGYSSQNPINMGQLVECMLFYQKVNVIADHSVLKQMLSWFGIDKIIELIEEDILSISYTESFAGIHTKKNNLGIEFHEPVIFTSPQHSFQDEIRKICIEIVGKQGKGKRVASRVEKNIQVIQHENMVLEQIKKDLLDQNYIKTAAPIVIKNLIPKLRSLEGAGFATESTDSGIVLNTNLNFIEINKLYHDRVPATHSSITSAFILSHISRAEHDLYFASKYLSEISTDTLYSDLIQNRFFYLIDKSRKSEKIKSDFFQNLIFNNAKMLQEAVNEKRVDLDLLVRVLKKSKKFKSWLNKKSPDINLIQEYYNEVTKESFIDKLPGKSVRFALFTGLGLAADVMGAGGVGTFSSTALSVVDTFLLDNLLQGWKPNQFIEDEVKKLVQK